MPLASLIRTALLATVAALAGCTDDSPTKSRASTATFLPAMRWDHRPEADAWTEATLVALQREGASLISAMPSDIGEFCPGYAKAAASDRRAFWAGMLSAMAKHESSWNPKARGGGGRWLGLMQISRQTADAYSCDISDDADLYDGRANLACAVRIAAAQVGRDGAIVSDGGGWRGLARDWAPMRTPAKRADIAAWTRSQSYCR